MNKKNIVLILILTMFLSVMVISIWGKVPEKSGRIDATSITFYDINGVEVTRESESMDKEKVIEFEVEDKDRVDINYKFSLVLGPEDTTDTDVYPEIKYGECTFVETTEKVPSKDETLVMPLKHTYDISFTCEEQDSATKIEFNYNKKGVTKRAYLIFQFKIHRSDIIDD